MDNREPKQSKIFTLLDRTGRTIKILKDAQCIFLFGKTRTGKSTSFNREVNHLSLIGYVNGKRQYKMTSELNPEDSGLAEIAGGYKSVTLIPNIHEIGNKYYLIDLPGYQENRGHGQVLCVSYIFNQCLQLPKRYKFILVTTESSFYSCGSDNFLSTLKAFAQNFKFDKMGMQEKRALINSISLLITSGRQDIQTYLQQLKIIKKDMRELQQKQRIYEDIIDEIIDSKRLDVFKEAQPNKNPSKSDIIDGFNKKNWKYCQNLSKCISYPQYQKLNQNEHQELKKIIEQRFESYETLRGHFVNLLGTFRDNMARKKIDLSSCFQRIASLIQTQNHYDNLSDIQHQVIIKQKDTLFPARRLTAFKKLQDINVQLMNSDDYQRVNQGNKERNYFGYLQKEFIKIITIFQKYFCDTLQQHISLQKIKFIQQKGFHEITIITKIDEKLKNQHYINMKSYLSIMDGIQQSYKKLIGLYITGFSQDQENFDIEQLQEIIDTFEEFATQNLQGILQQFYKASAILNLKLGEEYLKEPNINRQYKRILNCLLKSLSAFIKFTCCHCSKGQLQGQLNVQEQSQLVQFQHNILKKISECLQYMGGGEESLQILESIDEVELACNTYEHMIIGASSMSQKLALQERKANYCEGVGRISDAIEQWRKIQNETQETQVKRKAKAKLIQLTERRRRRNSFLESNQTIVRQKVMLGEQVLVQMCNHFNITYLRGELPLITSEQIRNIQKEHKKAKQKKITIEPLIPVIGVDKDYFGLQEIGDKIVKKASNKICNILFGGSVGKTTTALWLLQQNLKITNLNSRKYYDLNQVQRSSIALNHNGDNPTQLPNVLSINQNEVIIDFPNICNQNSRLGYLNCVILEKIIKNCRGMRSILVAQDKDLQNSDGIQFIEQIKFFFDMACLQKSVEDIQSILNSFSLIFTHVKTQNQSRQLLDKFKTSIRNPNSRPRVNLQARFKQNLLELIQNIMRNSRIGYFSHPDHIQFQKQVVKCTYLNDFESRNWAPFTRYQHQIYQSSLCRRFFDNLFPQERSKIILSVRQDIDKICRIVAAITNSLSFKIQILNSNFENIFEVIHQIVNGSSDIEEGFYQHSQIMENYINLERFIPIVRLININFQPFQDLVRDLPYGYSECYEKIKQVVEKSMNLFRQIICKNRPQLDLFNKAISFIVRKLTQLQSFTSIDEFSSIDEFFIDKKHSEIDSDLRGICNILDIFQSIIPDYDESLLQSFRIPELSNAYPNIEEKIIILKEYRVFLNTLIPIFSSRHKKQLVENDIRLLEEIMKIQTESNQIRESVMSKLELINLYQRKIHVEEQLDQRWREQEGFEGQRRQEFRFQKEKILKSIAIDISSIDREVAVEIGKYLSCPETIIQVYNSIINNNALNYDQRKHAIIQFINECKRLGRLSKAVNLYIQLEREEVNPDTRSQIGRQRLLLNKQRLQNRQGTQNGITNNTNISYQQLVNRIKAINFNE